MFGCDFCNKLDRRKPKLLKRKHVNHQKIESTYVQNKTHLELRKHNIKTQIKCQEMLH